MDKYSKKKIAAHLFTLIILFYSGCANQLPPGGGEVDRIPPEIIELYPADGTINFNDDYFELTFSEYVDTRSFKDALFISPAFEKNPEIEWSGRTVRVNFQDTLKQNVTYVVTIGTDLVDLNNKNRMAQAFNFTFSTGSEIDRRSLEGKVYADKFDGVMIFAYKMGSVDTLNPGTQKPDYISQAGADGSYQLKGLAAGTYRVFAFKDEFRDLVFQVEQDKYGAPFKDVVFNPEDTLVDNFNFFLTSVDTTAPRLISANMTDRYHILVSFTEPVDSSLISSPNFFIYDSTGNRKVNIKYAFKGATKPTEIVLVPADTLRAENDLYLTAVLLRDKHGNIYPNDISGINHTARADTVANGISRTVPQPGRSIDFQNQKFTFYFKDAFDSSDAAKSVSFTDTSGNKVPYNLSFPDDATIAVLPERELDPNKDYLIKLDLNRFKDAAGNKLDSIYTYKFRTISGFDFTGVSGVLTGREGRHMIIQLQSTDGKHVYSVTTNERNRFSFERVEAGKYRMWAFEDVDSSKTYNYGYPFPFIRSEEFDFHPDTLNLRPRWKITDVKFNFK